MPTPQETIDKFAALQGSGSQIPGIVREGNSFSAAPGSALRGELDIADAARPSIRPQSSPRGYSASELGQPEPNPNAGSAWRDMRVDRIAEAQRGDTGPITRAGNSFKQTLGGPSYASTDADALQREQTLPATQTAPGGYAEKPPRQTSFAETGAEGSAPGALLRDGFGNNRGPALDFQRQLNQVRADETALNESRAAAAERAPGTSYEEQRQAKADRFTRFVNESSTAMAAHNLGKGGGTLKSNAGEIAALQAMQARDAAAQSSELQRSAKIIEANTVRRGQDNLAKGQQLQHDTALAQILGSPAQQQGQMLDAAIKGGQLNSDQVLQTLQQKLLEASKNKDADGQARYAQLIQQLMGKTPESKLISFGGGQVVGPDGQLITQPSRLAYTGQAPTVVGEGSNRAGRPPSAEDIKRAQQGGPEVQKFFEEAFGMPVPVSGGAR
jgi:hypothetical protein